MCFIHSVQKSKIIFSAVGFYSDDDDDDDGMVTAVIALSAAGWDSEMIFSLCEPDSSGHHSRMLAEYEN